ncbi:MAG: hypothetical protein J7L20_01365 [Thermoplasmata archaeon]|nr:hypothetical protein [Thermoplasmata archaeon]
MKYLALFIACTLLFPGLAVDGKVKPLDVIKVTVLVKNETGGRSSMHGFLQSCERG